ncbi:DUF3566 domain-containing protein [Nocardioides donggukensis]|uniref:DUF3566 domain-containing protein n=1 Tax=Nocardioides donggukensis TaxID=2774019 RepID=A0A927Q338_9ACTN|nr:DUF3566 domain-containing protein [Nocardioides donggukensis]MBD8870974.1 DUF3566 domain-containing protein [Nocardioides donggukensis]
MTEKTKTKATKAPGSATLGERISGAFSTAADEMRASANPESKQHAEQAAKTSGGRRPRRARLRLTRIDPWSVMKTSFLLSVAFGIVTVVAVFIVWSVLGAAGVWESVDQMVADVIGGESTTNFAIEDYLGTSRVLGFTMLVAVIDVVLLTAIATLGAFLYNMAAALLGGVELTLAEDER